MKYFILSITLMVLFSVSGISQISKNTQVPDSFSYRKNAIRLEATSLLLYHNAFVFSYERMIKQNQSIVLTAGYQEMSGISSFSNSIKAINKNSITGYKLGGEYRFYLAKENKYASLHGLYVGPYFSALALIIKQIFKLEQMERSKVQNYLQIYISTILGLK